MGASYSNITLQGPERGRIIQALEARGRQAYVGPAENGRVVVFDEQSEGDPDQGAEFAQELTRELGGVALAVTVHDDDIFLYALVRDGQVLDEYNSCPGYFEGDEVPPSGGDAALLCSTLGSGDPARLEQILRAPPKEGDYVYEQGRHGDFAEALGLPEHSLGLGFGYVYQGDAEDLGVELEPVGFGEGEVTGAPGNADELRRARITRFPGGAESLAAMEAFRAEGQSPAHGYFRALLAGDAAAVRALFAGEPALDDPLSGRVDGAGLDAHVAAAKALFSGPVAAYAPVAVIETPERVVTRGQITGRGPAGLFVLPCACVWERGEGGFRELRAYWSPAAIKEQRGERAPILEPKPDLALPDVISRHLRALAADDIAGVTATYLEACLAPVPVPWLDPEDTVRRHYGAQVGNQGAVVITPCAVTATDASHAVEFVTTKWDGADIPPQAGLVVFDLRDGKICQVHLFGDLAPSPMAAMGGLAGLAGMGDMGGMGGLAGMGGMGGLAGMGGLGDLGGMEGLAGLGDMGGMPDLGGMEISPEVMQQAMQDAMRMLGGGGLPGMGNLSEMMESLQQMMGGMGGMPGLGGMPGMEGMQGWDDEDDPDGQDGEEDAGGNEAAGDEDAGASESGGAAPPK
ncbi:MAG TPA: nuclear transport factor 2 family protein [Longimicrobium sp.]|nr:nuclear transport factor 2 family protein [Longimicrobium sp.]